MERIHFHTSDWLLHVCTGKREQSRDLACTGNLFWARIRSRTNILFNPRYGSISETSPSYHFNSRSTVRFDFKMGPLQIVVYKSIKLHWSYIKYLYTFNVLSRILNLFTILVTVIINTGLAKLFNQTFYYYKSSFRTSFWICYNN